LNRYLVVAASLVIAVGIATSAFFLGAWAFGYRRYSAHQTRLEHLVALRPTLAQVVEALEGEGSPLVAAPANDDDLRRAAAERGRAKAAEVLEKGRRWARTRVFVADDMVYFIFFDDHGIMRDFSCVGK
jgi:hypothetical protein